MLTAGQSLDVLCKTCMRAWRADLNEDYENLVDFDFTNHFTCPWCQSSVNVAMRLGDKEEAINGFAFPPHTGGHRNRPHKG
jgi:hypothetical protein